MLSKNTRRRAVARRKRTILYGVFQLQILDTCRRTASTIRVFNKTVCYREVGNGIPSAIQNTAKVVGRRTKRCPLTINIVQENGIDYLAL